MAGYSAESFEGRLDGVQITEDTDGAMNAQIVEEYSMWKANAPYLYDLIINHSMDWPSLTVQWLPERAEAPGQDHTVQKVVLGTHTCKDYPNFLMIAEVYVPCEGSFVEHCDGSKKVPCACGFVAILRGIWFVGYFSPLALLILLVPNCLIVVL